MRKDISKLERKMRNQSVANKGLAQIGQKYKVQEKRLKVVIEELKQRVTAKASKLRRYDQRIKQYRQNRMFQCDQKRLYQELKGETVNNDVSPHPEESCKFWSNIWDTPTEHNRDVDWLEEVKAELESCNVQENVTISEKDVKDQLKKVANCPWKGPGPDGV